MQICPLRKQHITTLTSIHGRSVLEDLLNIEMVDITCYAIPQTPLCLSHNVGEGDVALNGKMRFLRTVNDMAVPESVLDV